MPLRLKAKAIAPPKDLPRAGADLWRKLQPGYVIVDEAGLIVLEVACRAFSVLKDAEAEMKKGGLILRGERGIVKANPCASIARDARSGMLQAFKQLGFAPPEEEKH